MSLVSSSLPNLVNGVSQQPYVQRLLSQGELQLNGYPSLVDGLRKRPPSVHLAKIFGTPVSDAYVHTINRSSTEQYTVVFAGSQIYVFDMNGNPRTVNAPNGWGYVATAYPQEVLSATTVADYTFITNRGVAVGLTGVLSLARPHEAIVWVRSGNYSTSYTLSVNGRSVTYTSADTSQPFNGAGCTTGYICNVLCTGLTGTPTLNGWAGQSVTVFGTPLSGMTVQNIGSSIYIANPAADFTISSSDGEADTAIVVSKGTVQSFSNLPAKCIGGVVFAVTGTGGDGTNPNYYVEYVADSSNPNGGTWVECPKPGEQIQFDPATMPHQLVRNADGTFTFQQATWANRTAGDLATLPFPSFVGRVVWDVFFYQDRLGFLADENVILSRAASPFDFTRASALQLLDTDPIDLGSTSTQASILKAAVPFQGTLLLFSDLVQFQLTYVDYLSPKTVSIVTATNFVANLLVKPVGAGANAYFAFSRGTWVGVREYYLDGAGRINDANDVTSHIPTYIPGSPLRLTVATNEDCLVMLADGDRTSLWVYRYYWQQGQKLQSAWSQWQFGANDTILSCEFIQNYLYVVISRADGVYLEVINIQPGYVETGQNFLVHLDRKLSNAQCTVSYSATTNLTTVTLPYAPTDWTKVQCVAWTGDATYKVGRLVPVTSTGATTFTAPGNLTSFFVGISYTFRYRFSTFTTREPVPMTYSMQAVTEGRLQIRNALVNYAGSGYFRAEVTPYARPMSTYVFTGRKLGDSGTVFGAPAIGTGVFKFPVQCQNLYAQIDLVNDSYLPCFFESAGWEGFFVLRSRRM